MQKRFLIIAVAALLMSCNNNKAKDATTQTNQTTIQNAPTLLDYMGIYEGQLPTASGSGMKVAITLSDGTYQKSVEYIGQSMQPQISSGEYSWDPTSSVITLLNEDQDSPNKYFVAENKLYQLDLSGNRITGDMAEDYVLKKK
jgi:uncharacterized lipoprotein NlpE involved in copper resistance